jgi:hypothetical protein
MVKFNSSKSITYPLHIAYNNQAPNTTEIMFLGMHLGCHLTWKQFKFNKKIEYHLLHAQKIVTHYKWKGVMV